MANRPHIKIKNKERCIMINVAIAASRNVMQKEAENRLLKSTYITNVEYEMNDYDDNNWRQRNSNKKLKRKMYKTYRENTCIQYIRYKRQLYLEHHT
jgi:hypothetical protein